MVLQTPWQFGDRSRLNKDDVSLPRLPVEHPSNRLDDPENLNLRGSSRMATSMNKRTDQMNGLPNIQEGVPVHIADDRSKVYLPIFGNADRMMSRMESRASSVMTSSTNNSGSMTNRLSSTELESMLWDKMKVGYFSAKNLFKSYDPEGRATATRENLHKILCTFLAMKLTFSQYNRLMKRIGFENSKKITFDEFYEHFKKNKAAMNQKGKVTNEYPTWFKQDEIDSDTMTASQVHYQLKCKAKDGLDELLITLDTNPGELIIKPLFREQLRTMGYHLSNKEFDKLWTRYDRQNTGAIDAYKLHEKLVDFDNLSSCSRLSRMSTTSALPSERDQSIAIEKWLGRKFKKGFHDLYHGFKEFENYDDGTVSREEFCSVLRDYGLMIYEDKLDAFLNRCNAPTDEKRIHYKNVLSNLQENRLVLNEFHKEPRGDARSIKTNITSIMVELSEMIHGDYMRLLNKFKRVDQSQDGSISVLEFRAILESFFDLTIRDDHFMRFLKTISKDPNGNVLYHVFMKNLQANNLSETVSCDGNPEFAVPKCHTSQSNRTSCNGQPLRDVETLANLVKDLFKNKFNDIQQCFNDLDEKNTKRMGKSTMTKLLKRIGLKFSKDEYNALWDTLMVDQHGTVEFTYFTRHFGYSHKSAAFPNSKRNPPIRGDADFRMLSQRLNSWKELIQDFMQSSVKTNLHNLEHAFKEIDREQSRYISSQDFKNVLTKVCEDLARNEIDMFVDKISLNNRIHWVELMKHLKSTKHNMKSTHNMNEILQHTQKEQVNTITDVLQEKITSKDVDDKNQKVRNLDEEKKSISITTKTLQDKISTVRWKNLIKTFPKYDPTNKGYVIVDDFRNMLKFCNITLNYDETITLLSKLDKKNTNEIYLDDLNDFYGESE